MTAHRVAPDRGPRDNEKMGYGHRAGPVQQQVSRRVRDATHRLGELERTQVGEPPRPLCLHATALAVEPVQEPTEGPAGALVDSSLVALRDARVPGRLSIAHLDAPPGDRLLVTGDNGSGKSTLLSLLAGRLRAEGEIRRRPGLSVGLLTQDTVFEHPDRTVRDAYTHALALQAGTRPIRHEANPAQGR